MAKHVKWKFPERDDNNVHISINSEWTLCGLGNEGGSLSVEIGQKFQELIITNRRVTCEDCISIVDFCKSVKPTEIKR